jgi:hypothetical protein
LTRKLIALNLALLAALGAMLFQARREWHEARVRERAFLEHRIPLTPALPLAPLPKPEPLTAAAYAPVAEKNLFSKDRNANVILDPPVTPPPKPVPPFPAARGVMLWDGVPPTVVLSEKPGGPQHLYHPGDKIGPWQIVSVDSQYVMLEWDGKQFQKRLDELLDKTPIAVAQTQTPAQAAAAPAPTPPPARQLSTKSSGPGDDVGAGLKSCLPGDSAPPGTVVDGMKKVIRQTPFGKPCYWEPVQ